MVLLRTILLAFFGFLLTSCGKYTYDTLPAERLHFGNKGGVTGELREYILLLDNRRLLFKDPLKSDLEKIGRVDAKLLSQLQPTLAQLPYDQSSPGNYNAVLVHHSADGQRELQWSSPKAAPNEATQALFESLMAEVRRLREKKGISPY